MIEFEKLQKTHFKMKNMRQLNSVRGVKINKDGFFLDSVKELDFTTHFTTCEYGRPKNRYILEMSPKYYVISVMQDCSSFIILNREALDAADKKIDLRKDKADKEVNLEEKNKKIYDFEEKEKDKKNYEYVYIRTGKKGRPRRVIVDPTNKETFNSVIKQQNNKSENKDGIVDPTNKNTLNSEIKQEFSKTEGNEKIIEITNEETVNSKSAQENNKTEGNEKIIDPTNEETLNSKVAQSPSQNIKNEKIIEMSDSRIVKEHSKPEGSENILDSKMAQNISSNIENKEKTIENTDAKPKRSRIILNPSSKIESIEMAIENSNKEILDSRIQQNVSSNLETKAEQNISSNSKNIESKDILDSRISKNNSSNIKDTKSKDILDSKITQNTSSNIKDIETKDSRISQKQSNIKDTEDHNKVTTNNNNLYTTDPNKTNQEKKKKPLHPVVKKRRIREIKEKRMLKKKYNNFQKFIKLKYGKRVNVYLKEPAYKVVIKDEQIFFHSQDFIFIYTPFATSLLKIKAKDIFVNVNLYILTNDFIIVYAESIIDKISINGPTSLIASAGNTLFVASGSIVYRIEEESIINKYDCYANIKQMLVDDKYLYVRTKPCIIARIGIFDGSFEMVSLYLKATYMFQTNSFLVISPLENGFIYLDKKDFTTFTSELLDASVTVGVAYGNTLSFLTPREIVSFDISDFNKKSLTPNLNLTKQLHKNNVFTENEVRFSKNIGFLSLPTKSSNPFDYECFMNSDEKIQNLLLNSEVVDFNKNKAENNKDLKTNNEDMKTIDKDLKTNDEDLKCELISADVENNKDLKTIDKDLKTIDEDLKCGLKINNTELNNEELNNKSKINDAEFDEYLKGKLNINDLENNEDLKCELKNNNELNINNTEPNNKCSNVNNTESNNKDLKSNKIEYKNILKSKLKIKDNIFSTLIDYNNTLPDDFSEDLHTILNDRQPCEVNIYDLKRVNKIFMGLKCIEDSDSSSSSLDSEYFMEEFKNEEIEKYLEDLEINKDSLDGISELLEFIEDKPCNTKEGEPLNTNDNIVYHQDYYNDDKNESNKNYNLNKGNTSNKNTTASRNSTANKNTTASRNNTINISNTINIGDTNDYGNCYNLNTSDNNIKVGKSKTNNDKTKNKPGSHKNTNEQLKDSMECDTNEGEFEIIDATVAPPQKSDSVEKEEDLLLKEDSSQDSLSLSEIISENELLERIPDCNSRILPEPFNEIFTFKENLSKKDREILDYKNVSETYKITNPIMSKNYLEKIVDGPYTHFRYKKFKSSYINSIFFVGSFFEWFKENYNKNQNKEPRFVDYSTFDFIEKKIETMNTFKVKKQQNSTRPALKKPAPKPKRSGGF